MTATIVPQVRPANGLDPQITESRVRVYHPQAGFQAYPILKKITLAIYEDEQGIQVATEISGPSHMDDYACLAFAQATIEESLIADEIQAVGSLL